MIDLNWADLNTWLGVGGALLVLALLWTGLQVFFKLTAKAFALGCAVILGVVVGVVALLILVAPAG